MATVIGRLDSASISQVNTVTPGSVGIGNVFTLTSNTKSISYTAVAATVAFYGSPPKQGMITFVDPDKTRKKRDPGRCYRKAGFKLAVCPQHAEKQDDCAACHSRTQAGLVALQLPLTDMLTYVECL